MDETHNWDAVEPHIIRHPSGCWVWDGPPLQGNVYRIIAEAYEAPLPASQKLFRMPDCELGKPCVNPSHLGTSVDFVLALNGRRQEIPEPTKSVRVVRLTKQDREFLRSVKVGWD